MPQNNVSQRVFLVNPPTDPTIREASCQAHVGKMNNGVLRAPIDLMYGAAFLERAGLECRIKDRSESAARSARELANYLRFAFRATKNLLWA